MWKARVLTRHVDHCDDTGDRTQLHNYILQTYAHIFEQEPAIRHAIPDPADDCTDADWIRSMVRFVRQLETRGPLPQS